MSDSKLDMTVLGLKLDAEDNDLSQPLEALVIVKGLDTDGELSHWIISTDGLNPIEGLGMARYAMKLIEKGMFNVALIIGDEEDD